MTDRVHALTVVLSQDIRDDDIEPLLTAIQQLRGVAGVTASVVDITDYSARMRANMEWRTKIIGLLRKDGAQ